MTWLARSGSGTGRAGSRLAPCMHSTIAPRESMTVPSQSNTINPYFIPTPNQGQTTFFLKPNPRLAFGSRPPSQGAGKNVVCPCFRGSCQVRVDELLDLGWQGGLERHTFPGDRMNEAEPAGLGSEEHTAELQSRGLISYA